MGYDREQVMFFDVNDRRMGQKPETFRQELTTGGAFVNLAASSNIPGRTFDRTGLQPEGASEEDIWIMSIFSINPETLPTLGMEIVRRLNFSRQMSTDTAGVVLINESAVKKLNWEYPINKRFYFDSDSAGIRVIGVVKDFHFIGLRQPIEPVLIRPINRFPGNVLVARIKNGFAYRVEIVPMLFIFAGIIALIVAILTVLGQSWRAALKPNGSIAI